MEIHPKLGFKTLAGLAPEQSNALHAPPNLADIRGTVWTINLADRDEYTERGCGKKVWADYGICYAPG